MSIEGRPFSEEEDAEHIEEDFCWSDEWQPRTNFLCKHAYFILESIIGMMNRQARYMNLSE